MQSDNVDPMYNIEKVFYKLSFDNEYLEIPQKVLRVQNDQNIEYLSKTIGTQVQYC